MAISITMPSELHVNKGGNNLPCVVSMLIFRMAELKRQSGTFLKVHASSYSTHKQGGPVPFTYCSGLML